MKKLYILLIILFTLNVVNAQWTTTPTSLSTNNHAYDIDFDNYGNIYVSGGTAPYKIAKYTSAGSILWTSTLPAVWGNNMYSKPTVIRNSGTVYISEGYSADTLRTLKLNSNGIAVLTYNLTTGEMNEAWCMLYNNYTGGLYAFGGSTQNSNNLLIFSDTNLTSSIVKNTNTHSLTDNDVADVVMDNNGDAYLLFVDSLNTNRLIKSLNSVSYNSPPAWDVLSGYNFSNKSVLDNITGQSQSSNAFNGLAVNNAYLFSYDGRTLKAWNKTSGALLDSLVVDSTYIASYRAGIDADDCNNIYVGGQNKVHVYNFSGSAFASDTTLTANIPGEVYDVKINDVLEKLMVCGDGFLTITFAKSCVSSVSENPVYIKTNVFPNPATNNITIEISQPTNESILSVYNINGQELIKQQIKDKKTQIDISNLISGIYFVKLVTDKSVEARKIVKE